MSINEAQAKINQIKELQRIIEEATEEMESLKDEIKTDMTTKGIDEMEAGQYRVRYKEVFSNRFDSKSFKEENKELYARYTKRTPSRRLTIA